VTRRFSTEDSIATVSSVHGVSARAERNSIPFFRMVIERAERLRMLADASGAGEDAAGAEDDEAAG